MRIFGSYVNPKIAIDSLLNIFSAAIWWPQETFHIESKRQRDCGKWLRSFYDIMS